MSKKTARAAKTKAPEFDTDVPLPVSKQRLNEVFHFDKMPLGGSFFEAGNTRHCSRVAGAARDYARGKEGMRFITRRFKKGDKLGEWTAPDDGVRVWRTA
jgi:hypothetical protein